MTTLLHKQRDPRLETLSRLHNNRLALSLGYGPDGALAVGDAIGRSVNGATAWPDGLTGLDRLQSQRIEFDSNFGINIDESFAVVVGFTASSGRPMNGAFIKLGHNVNSPGAGIGFGIGGSTNSFEVDSNHLLALVEQKAWVPSGATVSPGFHVAALFYQASPARFKFYLDGTNVSALDIPPPFSIAAETRIGGYTSSDNDNRHTSCGLHFVCVSSIGEGRDNFDDLITAASALYPAGVYVPSQEYQYVRRVASSSPTLGTPRFLRVTSSGFGVELDLS